jgi:hypothetical protein
LLDLLERVASSPAGATPIVAAVASEDSEVDDCVLVSSGALNAVIGISLGILTFECGDFASFDSESEHL